MDERTHIALDIGLEVAVEEPARFETLLVKAWERSPDDQLEGIPRRLVAPQLGHGKRPQGQQGGAPGQGLTDGLVQPGLVTPGEEEPSRIPGPVHDVWGAGR